MLVIKDLYAQVEDKPIIQGLNLTINPGEIHAIMGPNGSGKSTLSYILSGKDGYDITSGSISFLGKDLLDFEPEERVALGIFLAFQYPIEIPGVPTLTFMKTVINALRKARGEDEMDVVSFSKLVKEKAAFLDIDYNMLKRPLNVGFSGGEKKRNDILQMLLIEPLFCILDEADSGLDIDALKDVSKGINALRDQQRSMLVITHYQRLLNYVEPDFVHIFAGGKIVQTGDRHLALELEKNGYTHYAQEAV